MFKTSTPQVAKKCGICISTDHYTDECPSLMETNVENSSQAFAANTFGGNRSYQNCHDSSSNRYQQNMQPYVPLQQRQPYVPPQQRQPYVPPQQRQQSQPEMSLQDFMKTMLEQNSEIKKSIAELTQRVDKLETKESNKMPAQTVINPRNVNAITLRTGKQVEGPDGAQEDEDKEEEEAQIDDNRGPNESSPETTIEKFRRIEDNEVVNLGRNVSSLVKKHIEIPQKCKDPGMFSIPCVIGNSKFDNAMLDLGASINVMPLSVFTSLSLGPLKTTGVVIQLANRSTVNPADVLEDVLVRVDKLIFPADFYILDMKDEEGVKSSTIILGRPFMMTARTKIDVHAGTLTMEIGDEKVHFLTCWRP
ncbi:uncharacterized protein LOC106754657 [Vigna radiata var. radiata]|uniref:Uncharacterized protein LOC106754657 n=1 Tax=Vigna radiata var. radiata TaxID=3916 RepID=A0A1S3TEN0_VIGRR|nr:uncharacterized protein LOC106754657 [Vigna radiata var. radiata]